MKSLKNKKHWLIIVVVICVAVFSAILVMRQHNSHAGLVPEAGYKYTLQGGEHCNAISAYCGVCFGKVINQQCYVKPNSPYAKH